MFLPLRRVSAGFNNKLGMKLMKTYLAWTVTHKNIVHPFKADLKTNDNRSDCLEA